MKNDPFESTSRSMRLGAEWDEADAGENDEVCPACGKASFLNRHLDRPFHQDGSGNRLCWAAMSRGDA